MGNIVLLDDLTINKIAAGEVVERPASVVKELVENSIDAGANNITIEIKNGGISYIRITDNGKGIMPDDMEIAFERHATSKIRTAEDLQKVTSMGFRGEALASIAAISKVTMKSKTQDNDIGYEVVAQGGRIISKEETGMIDGTIITVEDLFYNTPVRYKFLRKDFTESGYIEDVITRIALSHPEIAIKLINTGKTIIQTSGNGDLKDVIYNIYGKDIAENILPVEYENEDIKITGVIGKPEISRANRSYQLFFINKRYVKDKIFSASSEQAFKGKLPIGKFAFLILNIEMNPQKVDVNVHPAKLEVRFEEEQKMFQSIYNAIKNTLSKSVTYDQRERQEETVREINETIQNIESGSDENDEGNILAQIYEARKQRNASNSVNYENTYNSLMNKIEQMKKEISETGVITEQKQEDKKEETKIEEAIIEEQINNILEKSEVKTKTEENEENIVEEDIINDKTNETPSEELEKVVTEKAEEQVPDVHIYQPMIPEYKEETVKELAQEEQKQEETIEENSEEQLSEKQIEDGETEENKTITEETIVMPVITIEENVPNLDQETIVLTDEMRQELSQKIQVEDETQVIPTIKEEIFDTNKIEEDKEERKETDFEAEKPFNEMFTSVFGKAPVQEEVAEEEEKYEMPEPEIEAVTSENLSIFENIESHNLPNYRVVGIAFDKYSIIEIDKELYIVNNQIANEKIIYEKLKENYNRENGKDSQLMLLPDIINLTSKQMDIANENMDMFKTAGFMLEPFGENTIKLSGVPEICMELDTKELFLEVLDEINKVARTDKEAVEDKFITAVASKIALKETLPQTEDEADDLMEELLGMPSAFDYQNGKPIAIKMTKADIERKFSRR